MLKRIMLLVWMFCGVVAAQPLVDHVPGDAVAYVGWVGSGNLAGYEQSHLKAVMDASDASKLFSQCLPVLIERTARGNPNAARKLQLISSIRQSLWDHPTAIYFSGVDTHARGEPTVRLTILCDGGSDAAEIGRQFAEVAAALGGSTGAQVKTEGTICSLVIGKPDETQGSLADNAQFKQTMAAVQSNSVIAAYVDIHGALGVIDELARTQSPEGLETWGKIKSAFRLESMRSWAWTGDFNGADWETQVFLSLPRTEPVGPAAGRMVQEQTLKMIPRDATACSACIFDLGRLFDRIREGLGQASPQYQQNFDKAVAAAGMISGVDIRGDFIGGLGDQWVVCSAPELAGNGLLSTVVINHLADPAKEDQALVGLTNALSNVAAGPMRRSGISITVKTITTNDGLTIHYIAAPLITPAWAVADGNLYLGLYPQVVAGAAAFERTGGQSILDNPTFAQMRTALGGQQVSAIGFVDISATIDSTYTSWVALSRYAGFADLFGAQAPAMFLPPIAKLKPQLGGAMTVSYWDQAGEHARSRSPFPGSVVLAGDPTSISPIASTALMASILLPSLNRARETANRVKCGSNMRQIGQGMLLYSNENRGNFPPDLGTLVITEEISPAVFLCPSSNSRLPVDFASMAPQEKRSWVNLHSDYIYLGKGKNSSVPPDTILLYEKDSDHHDGMNLLFGDGHVAFYQMSAAKDLIEKQILQ